MFIELKNRAAFSMGLEVHVVDANLLENTCIFTNLLFVYSAI